MTQDFKNEDYLGGKGYHSLYEVARLLYAAGIYTFGELRDLLDSPCADKLRLAVAENQLVTAQAKVNQLRSKMNKYE